MNHSSKKAILSLVVVALVCSCGDPGGVSDFQPRLEADITGDVVVHYSGNATFNTAPAARDGLPLFELYSRNRQKSPGVFIDEGYERIWFESWRRRPAVGEHVVSDRGNAFVDTSLTWIGYKRDLAGFKETYSAVSGIFDVTHSSDNRFEGSFAIEAVLYCRISEDWPTTPPEQGSCDPTILDPALNTITIVGTFTAGPAGVFEIVTNENHGDNMHPR
jgi:hypothetical protein